MDRRTFIASGAIAGAGTSLGAHRALAHGRTSDARPSPDGTRFTRQPRSTARIGFIGTGLRGREHLRLIALREDTKIPAICDIDDAAIAQSLKILADSGRPPADVYTGNEYAWEEMIQRDDLDGVIIATPWLWHTRMAVGVMQAGKYAGVEVSAANTLEECWDLVNTYETTGMPCMIMENVCYRRDVMAILQMVREGLFGELLHLECGYQHDLREVKFNNGRQPYGGGVEFGEKGYSEAGWRTWHSVHRNGDIYPTHGIGPVGIYLDINRGNRFTALSSVATKSRGLHKYIVDQAGPDHPNADIRFKLGDIVTSTIQTQHGETIIVKHDTNNPRPYSLGFRVQGTNGLWMDVMDRLHIEGRSPKHQWENAAPWLEKHDHPLWRRFQDRATGAGHGGMDFFVDHAFVESIKAAADTPLDAYDAAAWSAITPLSEMSIAAGGAVQAFPDFTRGRWMTRRMVFALDDSY
ncbi:MAG: glycosyl hydrolase [Bacteroidetes bacterium CG12_big_fil_rev_8_21_14_0_65_60_17]|nr:MAG: glycosyl hydrolase [Bacteroidetes bacterium CG12_big_fil_rev_8_21_14_0_65_60_17]